MAPSALSSIVKSYDVRGLVDSELTPEVVKALGAAFVDVIVGSGNQLALGYDMRDSSPVLAAAFIEGAHSSGGRVLSIGLCSTDMVYFASGVEDVPSVMFTASHNPATYNGLKFSRHKAQGVSMKTGLAEIRDRAAEYLEGGATYGSASSEVIHEDVVGVYAAYLRSLVSLEGIRPLRVVVDAANGMAGHTVPAVLGTAAGLTALPLEIIPLYFELDGSFPNHEANPLEPANLVDLQKAVVEHGADIGLAFDGDADRCFVVDNLGQPVTPSTVAAMVAKREIQRARDAGESGKITVIHNLICSKTVADVIEENGGVPLRTQVGHSFIKDTMRDSGAVFGGEHSAHYYFRDFWGADNGMIAALHVLSELGNSSEPLSELVSEYSRYVESGEINSVVSDQATIFDALREAFAGRGDVDTLDGLTITGSEGAHFWWFNVRASNTEPLMRLNVEAETTDVMESIRDEVLTIIRA
ncbi:MAG: phosphomannomutase/phosphoglucomutase [Microbacteriaceae bacterium]|nr:phosphomannomutase/phosphoglucomutase [Microbacteriaceae bacterium]